MAFDGPCGAAFSKGLDVGEPLKSAKVSDTLRMPQKDIERILAEIDRTSRIGNSRRRMRRRTMSGQKLVVVVMGTNNVRKSIVAVGRNLSATGLGFMCGGYMHSGQRCVVALRDLQGRSRGLPGTIMRCGHIKGHLHDIGVRFDDAIKPEDFIEMEGDDVFNIENVDPDELEGRVLVVEDSRAEQRLIAHHLKGTRLALDFVSDGAAGLQSLGDQPDLVVVDQHLPDTTGTEWIVSARSQGLTHPIVMLASDESAELRKEARAAGADAVIYKPVTKQNLVQAIAEFLIGECSSQPQVSMEALGLNDELLEQFVRDLHGYAEQIADLIEQQGTDQLHALLLEIRGATDGHGFASVAVLAGDAAKALSASKNINDALEDLQRLMAACQSARVPKKAQDGEDETADESSKAA